MKEEVEIGVKLSSDWFLTPPAFEFWIDDIKVVDDFVPEKNKENKEKMLSWIGNLDEGEHTIKIVLKNKSMRETVISKLDNNIIHDQLLYVDDVSIDQINLGFLVFKLSKFFPDNTIRPDLDDVIPNLNCIGYNGEWRLKFRVPTYLWLLENF